MTKEQAEQIIKQALSQMKLTLPEHEMLQQALKVLTSNGKVN
jgi:hypothetical protein